MPSIRATTLTRYEGTLSLIRNSGRHQHHCRSRTRWPEFLIRLLASNLEQWLDENDAKLRVMQWWFTVGLALLLIELGAWIAHLELVQG